MNITEAVKLFTYHQRASLKARTLKSYAYLLEKLQEKYPDHAFDSMGPDEIYQFLEDLTNDCAKSTRRLRYAQIKAFCNFRNLDLDQAS